MFRRILFLTALQLFFICAANSQTTQFTYQASLRDGSEVANGNYDFEFALFDSLVSGSQVGPTLSRSGVTVSNGSFQVQLDFGDQFPGANRYIEIRIRPQGSGSIVTLTPRQILSSSPYSVKSLTAELSANANNAQTSISFSGALTGDVSGSQSSTIISNNAITTGKLADNSVTDAKVVSINGSKILGTVANATTAQTSVNFTGPLTGDVTGLQAATVLSNNSVTTVKLADNSVTDPKIVSVSGSKVLGAVANSNNATNAQTSINFSGTLTGEVSGLQSSTVITNNAVTTGKLADNSVTDAKIVSVNGNKIIGSVATATNATNATVATNAVNATTASNFSGPLGGDVVGGQNNTTVTKLRNATLPVVGSSDDGKYLRYKNDGVNPGSFELSSIPSSTSGGITSITAGSGLAGGGSTSKVTISLASGGVLSSNLADNSVTDAKIVSLSGSKISGAVSLASNATVANSFSTGLSGDVTGLQNSTVVTQVGGASASTIANATSLTNAATDQSIAGTLVRRDSTSGFSAGAITSKGIFLPTSTSSTTGVISQNGVSVLHTFGTDNFFAGPNSGNFVTTGTFNAAAGGDALRSNTTGGWNTAVGYRTLFSNTTGANNTAVGGQALISNTIGSGNSAFGQSALVLNLSGVLNTAVGTGSLRDNTSGGANTGVGYSALEANTTGTNNTSIGLAALRDNRTGNNNIAVGYTAGINLTTGNNNIAVGNEGVAGESNTIRIGTNGVQTDTYLTGIIHGNGSGLTNLPATSGFTGSLNGDVTGTQSATVVSSIGPLSAATIVNGVNAANGASSSSSANTIIKRDASNRFAARSIAIDEIDLQSTTGATTGVIAQNGDRLFHTFGTNNFFAGYRSGNFSLTGEQNTAAGPFALQFNSSGGQNAAFGVASMQQNTSGSFNAAVGAFSLSSNTTGTHNTALGAKAMAFNTTGISNTASGFEALGSNTTGSFNTANGYLALDGNSTGQQNTAVGAYALFSSDAEENVAIGYSALRNNTSGVRNSANGASALINNVSGNNNTAVGASALRSNTSGPGNTATGASALQSNTIGNWNTSTGFNSLMANSTGGGNTANGYSALQANTTGAGNTAIGNGALQANSIGDGNIAIGSGAGSLLTSGNFNISIGNSGVAGESNTIRIGNSNLHSRTFLSGVSGVTTSGTSVPVVIDGDGQLGTISSSVRFKNDVRNMPDFSQKLMALRPVTFRYNQAQKDGTHPIQYGLVAEEVAKIDPNLVQFDSTGKPSTVLYHVIPTLLLKEYQQQQMLLKSQKEKIAAQDQTIRELVGRISAIETLLTKSIPKNTGRKSSTTLKNNKK